METIFSHFLVHFSFPVGDKKRAQKAPKTQSRRMHRGDSLWGIFAIFFSKNTVSIEKCLSVQNAFSFSLVRYIFFRRKKRMLDSNFFTFLSPKTTFLGNFWTPLIFGRRPGFLVDPQIFFWAIFDLHLTARGPTRQRWPQNAPPPEPTTYPVLKKKAYSVLKGRIRYVRGGCLFGTWGGLFRYLSGGLFGT